MVVLVLFYASGEAFFGPAFSALVPDILEQDDVLQASALEQFVRQACRRLIGPAIGGLLVAAAGAGNAFLIDAGTFLFSATAIALMQREGRAWRARRRLDAARRHGRRPALRALAPLAMGDVPGRCADDADLLRARRGPAAVHRPQRPRRQCRRVRARARGRRGGLDPRLDLRRAARAAATFPARALRLVGSRDTAADRLRARRVAVAARDSRRDLRHADHDRADHLHHAPEHARSRRDARSDPQPRPLHVAESRPAVVRARRTGRGGPRSPDDADHRRRAARARCGPGSTPGSASTASSDGSTPPTWSSPAPERPRRTATAGWPPLRAGHRHRRISARSRRRPRRDADQPAGAGTSPASPAAPPSLSPGSAPSAASGVRGCRSGGRSGSGTPATS